MFDFEDITPWHRRERLNFYSYEYMKLREWCLESFDYSPKNCTLPPNHKGPHCYWAPFNPSNRYIGPHLLDGIECLNLMI